MRAVPATIHNKFKFFVLTHDKTHDIPAYIYIYIYKLKTLIRCVSLLKSCAKLNCGS
jgi:hypothetical protein